MIKVGNVIFILNKNAPLQSFSTRSFMFCFEYKQDDFCIVPLKYLLQIRNG
ncbi:hypothetical protein Pf1_01864 [Flavobacterium columnare]|nr:hypothetical protein Pf1_01864 [Flavobacterium columnare]